MRWIIVFLFLYFIPLIVLFKNYNNIKRTFIYASMYTVLVTTIVITNVYISGLNKIKEIMYYQKYSIEDEYTDDTEINESINETIEIENKETIEFNYEYENSISLNDQEDKNKEKEVVNYDSKKTDKQLIYEFKKEIYEIELKALIPMRECITYTKNIAENLKKLEQVRQDLEHSSDMCREVIGLYETMEIPQLSNNEYTEVLNEARNDVKSAYELREKAMESAITLINTKNPKYIGKITEYLNLSDNCIANFKNRLTDLNKMIEK